MQTTGTPTWVWGFIIIAIVPAMLALGTAMFAEFFGPKPRKRVRTDDTEIELWVRERKFPGRADAIVAPVSPDLKMVTGIAKWVRDSTANRVQAEAESVAPLPPGEAFVSGSAGRYRFKMAALAVVMDDKKQTSPDWIATGLTRALNLAAGRDARTVIVPDFTEDLLRQPTTITDEQRRQTAAPIARAMLDGILAGSAGFETVKIWVWRTVNEDIFVREMESLEAHDTGGRLAQLVEG